PFTDTEPDPSFIFIAIFLHIPLKTASYYFFYHHAISHTNLTHDQAAEIHSLSRNVQELTEKTQASKMMDLSHKYSNIPARQVLAQ
ncbi:TPA: hypothetical protein ACHXKG_005346, partial [Escherichia coli]